MLHLRKYLLPLLRAASHPTVSPPSSHTHGGLLLFSASASPTPFSLDAYLVTACGLTPAQALKASNKAFKEASKMSKKSMEPSGSASNPDAVLALLSEVVGLFRPDIAAIVAADPLLLRANVEDVSPQLAALRDRLGLSAPQIARFLLLGSRALRSRTMLPNLEFLISFYGSFDQLLQALKCNYRILCYYLEKVIRPHIALFRRCGLSDRQIVQMSLNAAWVLAFNPARVKEFVLRADELVVPRSSGMFRMAIATVACVSPERIAAKLEFFKKSLGCFEAMLRTAVRRQPYILRVSEENFRRKCDFLINEAGLKPEAFVERSPVLFMCSLQRRLTPRHYVLKVLQAKRLIKSYDFPTAATLSEKKFKLKFIDCHKDCVPGLGDAYAAVCAGGVPSQVQLCFSTEDSL